MEGNHCEAIKGLYNGIEFRSRLEIRWAIFFDKLGINYLYEPEGWEMDNGMKYLPDFYLPDLGYWVEVKGFPTKITRALEKMKRFVQVKQTTLIVLGRLPDFKVDGDGHLYDFPIMYWDSRAIGGEHVRLRYGQFVKYRGEAKFLCDDAFNVNQAGEITTWEITDDDDKNFKTIMPVSTSKRLGFGEDFEYSEEYFATHKDVIDALKAGYFKKFEDDWQKQAQQPKRGRPRKRTAADMPEIFARDLFSYV